MTATSRSRASPGLSPVTDDSPLAQDPERLPQIPGTSPLAGGMDPREGS